MEMNCFVRGNNVVDSSGYWLPVASYQQQLLMPLIPFSMMMNAAAAAASNFHVNENPKAPLDFANNMADNIAWRDHAEEVDRFLLMQTERLKSTLQQQWKQHLASIAMNSEAKFFMLLMQKDKALAEGKKEAMKLKSLLKKALLEKEKWEKIARKLNIRVSILSQTLEKVQKPCFSSTGGIKTEEEVASCFCIPKEEEEIGNEPSPKRKKGNNHDSFFLCQICRSGFASVLILPCRHLCMCKQCEAIHCWCPICRCVKKETMEVLFS